MDVVNLSLPLSLPGSDMYLYILLYIAIFAMGRYIRHSMHSCRGQSFASLVNVKQYCVADVEQPFWGGAPLDTLLTEQAQAVQVKPPFNESLSQQIASASLNAAEWRPWYVCLSAEMDMFICTYTCETMFSSS